MGGNCCKCRRAKITHGNIQYIGINMFICLSFQLFNWLSFLVHIHSFYEKKYQMLDSFLTKMLCHDPDLRSLTEVLVLSSSISYLFRRDVYNHVVLTKIKTKDNILLSLDRNKTRTCICFGVFSNTKHNMFFSLN